MAKKAAEAKPGAARQTEALKALLGALPGVTAHPMAPPRSAAPMVVLYKVMAKTFAILSVRGDAFVLVKTDAHLAEMLRGQYEGIGHRSHLDRRFWIAIDLGSDVPLKETKRLAADSYARVAASLTKAQKAALVKLEAA